MRIRPLSIMLGDEDDDEIGTSKADVVFTRGGNDRFQGLGGNDELNGNAGDDELFGNSGNDKIRGGIGDDQRLSGGGGNDIINGNSGADRLSGGGGDDLLRGGGDEDRLIGGSGGDTIDGGAAEDRVTGGGGADTFVLKSTRQGVDTITDFDLGETDRIRFERLFDDAVGGVGDLVQLTSDGGDTVLAVAPAADGDFTAIARLLDADLSLDDLIDAGAILGLPGDSDEPPRPPAKSLRANDDTAQINEDARLVIADLLDNDGGQGLEIIKVGGSSDGEVRLLGNGNVEYDPRGLFDSLPEGGSALDQFTYTVRNGDGDTDTASVEVTVTGRNDAPEARASGNYSVVEGETPLNVRMFRDPDQGDSLSYEVERADGGPRPSWMNISGGRLTGDPKPPEQSIALRATATDKAGDSSSTNFVVRNEVRGGDDSTSNPRPNNRGYQEEYIPAISGDGRLLAFTHDRGQDIGEDDYVVRLQDTRTGQIVDLSDDIGGEISAPAISKDGSLVAYIVNLPDRGELRVEEILDFEGPVTQRVVTGEVAVYDGRGVALSGDGRVMAFTDDGGTTFVRLPEAGDSLDLGDLPSVFLADAGGVVLSQDGRSFAYRDSSTFELRRGELDRQSMTIDDDIDVISSVGSSPSISGNGRFVAFEIFTEASQGDGGGRNDIRLYDASDKSNRLVSVDGEGIQSALSGSSPALSEDGTLLFYLFDEKNVVRKGLFRENDLEVLDINAADQLTVPDRLNDLLVSADGRNVVAVSSEAQGFRAQVERINENELFEIGFEFDDIPDSPTGAEPLTANGDQIDSTISFEGFKGDEDWFALELSAARIYMFELAGIGDDALANPLLQLRDGDGNPVEVATDPDPSDGFIEFSPNSNGSFILSAEGREGSMGDYRLSVESEPIVVGPINPFPPVIGLGAVGAGGEVGSLLTPAAEVV